MLRSVILGCLLSVTMLPADEPVRSKSGLILAPGQKEFLTLEPILVVVRLDDGRIKSVPAQVDDAKGAAILSFDIQPKVKVRPGAKPLPMEMAERFAAADRPGSEPRRLGIPEVRRAGLFDLLEWYQFPAEGQFAVRAVIKQGETVVTSEPVTLVLRRPDKKDAEWGPVDRLHHMPWSNYVVDCFCGDTFDVAKRWPDSKFAKYCHFYNGLYQHHKKEYDKATVSFRTVIEKYPDFLLAPNAENALFHCLLEQKNWVEANTQLQRMNERLRKDTSGRFISDLSGSKKSR